MITKENIADRLRTLQDHICAELEKLDGVSRFAEDVWVREEGGGGRTRTIQKGAVIEKGGVAFSEVYGPVSDVMKKQLGLNGDQFFATGVSIVLHPMNPHVPIIHMNVRYFEMDSGEYWFGGGIDLTPHYIVPSLAGDFHRSLKTVCDKYNDQFYSKFKIWADDYFYNSHRAETRGVGGIFYDHLDHSSGLSKGELLSFATDLGELFSNVYRHQVDSGKNKLFGERELNWRNLRRGRYVEFNLVHDRGTKFGLLSGGRTESILLSMPPLAEWEYCFKPEKGSPEDFTLSNLRKDMDWLNS